MKHEQESTECVFGEKRQKLSEILAHIFDETRPVRTWQSVFDELEHHGLAILLVFFSLWSALPIPAAGYSTILSLPLFAIGLCFLFNRKSIALPKKIGKRNLVPGSYEKLRRWLFPALEFLERYSRPRGVALVRSYVTRLFLGAIIIVLAISMFIPIPGTNTLPAIGVFLIGFSLLEDDGAMLLFGIFVSILSCISTTLIILFGYEAVKAVIKASVGFFS
jgi:hypothetical protein